MTRDRQKLPSDDRAESEQVQRTLDATFELLSDGRRRYLLYAVGDEPDRWVSVDRLVARVAEIEAESNALSPPPDHRRRVAASVYHTHLPKLAAENAIERDEAAGTARYVGGEPLDTYLDLAAERELD